MASTEDLTAVVRGLAWRSAPVAEVDVDLRHDRLLVSCVRAMADVEVEINARLSVGFQVLGDVFLLTTLCLIGLSGWGGVDRPDVHVARGLLGESLATALDPGVEGSTLHPLSSVEAEGLMAVWRDFVRSVQFDSARSRSSTTE